MRTVNIHAPKIQRSRLIDEAAGGEDIILARALRGQGRRMATMTLGSPSRVAAIPADCSRSATVRRIAALDP